MARTVTVGYCCPILPALLNFTSIFSGSPGAIGVFRRLRHSATARGRGTFDNKRGLACVRELERVVYYLALLNRTEVELCLLERHHSGIGVSCAGTGFSASAHHIRVAYRCWLRSIALRYCCICCTCLSCLSQPVVKTAIAKPAAKEYIRFFFMLVIRFIIFVIVSQ